MAERFQHRAPGTDLQIAAPLQAARHRIDALALRAFQIFGLVIQAAHAAWRPAPASVPSTR